MFLLFVAIASGYARLFIIKLHILLIRTTISHRAVVVRKKKYAMKGKYLSKFIYFASLEIY